MLRENWFGVENILAAIIEKIPPPSGDVDEPLQALILILI
jgi:GTP-binding protein LepA